MDYEVIESQIRVLEDVQAIEDLQKIYGYYFDLQMWPEVIALFSEHVSEKQPT